MDGCISARASRPLEILIHAERWLTSALRKTIEENQDAEALVLLTARESLRAAIRELLTSNAYGGPPGPRRGVLMLIRVDARITELLIEARARRWSLDAKELREARETVRHLMAQLADH
jgi:hypothetical protein